jgi:hypothetical protein
MSERDILIRALRASGSEREAQLAEAILPAPAPVAPAEDVKVPEAQAPPTGLTLADLDKMTVNEIAKLDTKIVDAALAEGAS